MEADDPVALFERATTHAATLMSAVSPSQLNDATPCSRSGTCSSSSTTWWALAGEPPAARTGGTVEDYRRGLEQLRSGLRTPGALERMCTSPLGFEWSVGHAVAGTFMDALIHTWDLATATGHNAELDPDLVDACIAMFLPDRPERGRASGLVGPAVHVPEDAPPQDRLLAAMGRRP